MDTTTRENERDEVCALMCFDDPIYLDRESFEDLMDDTDQHRICWMYHDILSDPRIAWMFDRYAGKGTPIREAWTTMAWVAASQQEDSFYLLFKWYADFYGPPERSDLYLIERDQSDEDGVRVRPLDLRFQHQLSDRGRDWFQSMWAKVSDNASRFFGESEFDTSPIVRIQHLLDESGGRALEAFDWYLGPRTDGEKSIQCATIACYYEGIQAIEELIYHIVVYDEGGRSLHQMPKKDLLAILDRIDVAVDVKRLSELAGAFRDLSDSFCLEPTRTPFLGHGAGRLLMTATEAGDVRWLRLDGRAARRLVRRLYCACAPRTVWDVFHRWRGEVFFTVFRRPPFSGLRRGSYLLARFEDQTGQDVTDLFWIENVTGGLVHLCEGAFFDELLDQLLARPAREAVLRPGGRALGADPIARLDHQLKATFDEYDRG